MSDALVVLGGRKGSANWKVEEVGWKAYGIRDLPESWVPPFFVLTAEAHRIFRNCLRGDDEVAAWPVDHATLERALTALALKSGTLEIGRAHV